LSDHQTKESKIPVLTEVYQPKSKTERVDSKIESAPNSITKHDDPTLGITPEFIARVTGHVRPRLEAEITQSVMDNLREVLKKDLIKELQIELNNTRISLEANTANFVDKTKADLKTELPRMYQASAELVHNSLQERIAVLQTDVVSKVDRLLADVMQTSTQAATAEISTHVEALRTEAAERITQELHGDLQVFQENLLQQQQSQASDALNNAYQIISESAEQALNQHVENIQGEALTQVRNDLNAAIPDIYAAAVNEVKTKFIEEMQAESLSLKENFLTSINADLPEVQAVLRDNIQQILASALPALEQDLRLQLTDELQQLLLKVKFVLP
jgi:hypothetical protein